jgi:hypothetical protein
MRNSNVSITMRYNKATNYSIFTPYEKDDQILGMNEEGYGIHTWMARCRGTLRCSAALALVGHIESQVTD